METLTEETRDAIEASHVPDYALHAIAEWETRDLDADYIGEVEGRYMGEDRDAESWAQEYIHDSGMLDEMPAPLRYYFDAGAWMRDACLEGSLTVVDVGGAVAVFSSY